MIMVNEVSDRFSDLNKNYRYPINVQTAEPIGPKFHVGHHMTPGKVYERAKFQKLASNKIRFSLNLIIHEAFLK